MNLFTVILLYPPLPLTETSGNESYTAWVQGEDERAAIKAARREAFYRMAPSDRRGSSPKRFRPVVAVPGHVPVYNPECHSTLKPPCQRS